MSEIKKHQSPHVEFSRSFWTDYGYVLVFYFKTPQTGDVSRVAPIDKLSVVITILLSFFYLKKPVNTKTIIGALLITADNCWQHCDVVEIAVNLYKLQFIEELRNTPLGVE